MEGVLRWNHSRSYGERRSIESSLRFFAAFSRLTTHYHHYLQSWNTNTTATDRPSWHILKKVTNLEVLSEVFPESQVILFTLGLLCFRWCVEINNDGQWMNEWMNASVDRYLNPSGQSKSSHMIFIGYSAHSVQAQVEILIRRIPRSINDFTQFTGSF